MARVYALVLALGLSVACSQYVTPSTPETPLPTPSSNRDIDVFIPEPGTLLLVGTGIAILSAGRARRRSS